MDECVFWTECYRGAERGWMADAMKFFLHLYIAVCMQQVALRRTILFCRREIHENHFRSGTIGYTVSERSVIL